MNRVLSKRLLLVGLPLGILVTLWAVPYYSQMFEGRLWLRERSCKAVRMDVAWNQTFPAAGEQLGYVSTTNSAEIQNTLWTLNCVGSLNNGQHKARVDDYYRTMWFYSIRLRYADGGVDVLTLCGLASISPAYATQDLVHNYSSSGEGVALSTARVSEQDLENFESAYQKLEHRYGRKFKAFLPH